MIAFSTHNIQMPDIRQNLIREWIHKVAASYDRKTGDITYIFCDDEKILEVNRQFLSHDYYTDIITFDYSSRTTVSGDLFISLDTVLTNSRVQNTSYTEELHRVIIHGILHLCGINDKAPGEREVMEEAENRALTIYKSMSEEKNRCSR